MACPPLPCLPRHLHRMLPSFMLSAGLSLLLGCSLRTSALEAMSPPQRLPAVPPRDPWAGPATPAPLPARIIPSAGTLAQLPSGVVRASYQTPMLPTPESPPDNGDGSSPGVLPLPEVHEELGTSTPASPGVPPEARPMPSSPDGTAAPGKLMSRPISPIPSPSGVIVPPAAGAADPSADWNTPPSGMVVLPGSTPSNNQVVVNLAAVLRMADAQNPRILLGRERVNEAALTLCLAETCCKLPSCRDKTPRPAEAEAKVWQRRAELARTRYDVLSDAGTTYVNWITALRTEAIFLELEGRLQRVLSKAENLARDERSANVLVSGIRTAIASQVQLRLIERQNADAAAIRLIALLNMPNACLVPADHELVPVQLVDVSQPCEALLTQALSVGPAVRELEQMRAVVQKGIAQARMLQVFARLGCSAACTRLEILQSKEHQVSLSLERTRCDLARGVLQERDAILITTQRMATGQQQVTQANETFRLADIRLNDHRPEEAAGVYSQMLQSIRSLEVAEVSSVTSVSGHNQAQVRLYLLLGNSSTGNSECGFVAGQ